MKEVDETTFERMSDFIKLKVGENYIQLLSKPFRGDFHEMKTSKGFVSAECKGANCENCRKSTRAPITKYIWIGINRVTNQVGILKLSKGLAEKICEEGKKQGTLENKMVKINRKGTTKEDTIYTFEIMDINDTKPLTAELNEKIADTKPKLIKKYLL